MPAQHDLTATAATTATPSQRDVAIWCDGLQRSFGERVALWDLSLSVPRGEVLALLGPNGAGKTTTVRLLNGVLRPDGGRAGVLDLDPSTQGDELRRRTGVLTENAGLDDRLTARENLLSTARMRGIEPGAAGGRVTALLERFGMTELADARCQGFSTGQRRRVALARALLHDPEILFLDEPTSGLDPAATLDVVELIERLTTERGRTVILCTHFLSEAARLADQMAILDRGRVVVSGRPAELAASLWPGHEVDIDLGRPGDQALVQRLTTTAGVRSVTTSAGGLAVNVEHRDAVPAVVATITAAGAPVYAVTPIERTLEDIYFAYQPLAREEHGAVGW